jgi:Domain of unknown function (DUF5753)/Helix-turn-helix domain
MPNPPVVPSQKNRSVIGAHPAAAYTTIKASPVRLCVSDAARGILFALVRPSADGSTPSRPSANMYRHQLQALREKAGLSYEQAAQAIYSSEWTIRRVERAEGGLKPLTVKSLLQAYGITDPGEIDTFVALARDASKPGWWHSYDDVLPPWFRTAVGLEESATLIRAYEPQVVPGLLQTDGYIRAITEASFPAASADFTERAVALRLARQHLLTRPEPPAYWVVLDETVLRRPIGGRHVMRSQLEHLIAAAAQPKVTIQVIPFAAGWHPALYGMFNTLTILREILKET